MDPLFEGIDAFLSSLGLESTVEEGSSELDITDSQLPVDIFDIHELDVQVPISFSSPFHQNQSQTQTQNHNQNQNQNQKLLFTTVTPSLTTTIETIESITDKYIPQTSVHVGDYDIEEKPKRTNENNEINLLVTPSRVKEILEDKKLLKLLIVNLDHKEYITFRNSMKQMNCKIPKEILRIRKVLADKKADKKRRDRKKAQKQKEKEKRGRKKEEKKEDSKSSK